MDDDDDFGDFGRGVAGSRPKGDGALGAETELDDDDPFGDFTPSVDATAGATASAALSKETLDDFDLGDFDLSADLNLDVDSPAARHAGAAGGSGGASSEVAGGAEPDPFADDDDDVGGAEGPAMINPLGAEAADSAARIAADREAEAAALAAAAAAADDAAAAEAAAAKAVDEFDFEDEPGAGGGGSTGGGDDDEFGDFGGDAGPHAAAAGPAKDADGDDDEFGDFDDHNPATQADASDDFGDFDAPNAGGGGGVADAGARVHGAGGVPGDLPDLDQPTPTPKDSGDVADDGFGDFDDGGGQDQTKGAAAADDDEFGEFGDSKEEGEAAGSMGGRGGGGSVDDDFCDVDAPKDGGDARGGYDDVFGDFDATIPERFDSLPEPDPEEVASAVKASAQVKATVEAEATAVAAGGGVGGGDDDFGDFDSPEVSAKAAPQGAEGAGDDDFDDFESTPAKPKAAAAEDEDFGNFDEAPQPRSSDAAVTSDSGFGDFDTGPRNDGDFGNFDDAQLPQPPQANAPVAGDTDKLGDDFGDFDTGPRKDDDFGSFDEAPKPVEAAGGEGDDAFGSFDEAPKADEGAPAGDGGDGFADFSGGDQGGGRGDGFGDFGAGDDDFGDFGGNSAANDTADDGFGDFEGGAQETQAESKPATARPPAPPPQPAAPETNPGPALPDSPDELCEQSAKVVAEAFPDTCAFVQSAWAADEQPDGPEADAEDEPPRLIDLIAKDRGTAGSDPAPAPGFEWHGSDLETAYLDVLNLPAQKADAEEGQRASVDGPSTGAEEDSRPAALHEHRPGRGAEDHWHQQRTARDPRANFSSASVRHTGHPAPAPSVAEPADIGRQASWLDTDKADAQRMPQQASGPTGVEFAPPHGAAPPPPPRAGVDGFETLAGAGQQTSGDAERLVHSTRGTGGTVGGGEALVSDAMVQLGISQWDPQQQAWIDSLPKLGFITADRIRLPPAAPQLSGRLREDMEELKAI